MFSKITFPGGHQFEQLVDESIHDFCLILAKETALKKLRNTADTWQSRHPNAKIMDLLFGDYAKNIVKQYLYLMMPDVDIIEYEQIRTDNFVNRDLFDLKIGNDEIEVKSSLEKYSRNLNTINTDRNIIINRHYSHISNAKYIFQVFYIPNNLSSFISMEAINLTNSKEFSSEIFTNHIQDFSLSKMDVFICGWIRNVNTAQGSFGVRNSNTGANFRTYARMPIKDSHNPEDFINEYI